MVRELSKQDRDTLDCGNPLLRGPGVETPEGVRPGWYLRNEAVLSGSLIEICVSADPEYDDDGEIVSFAHQWVLVRAVYSQPGNLPVIYLPIAYAEDLTCIRIPDGARFKWPAGSPQMKRIAERTRRRAVDLLNEESSDGLR